MFKNKILKKLGAGLMAGLCAFSMLGTNIGSFKASAAETAQEPLLTSDEVIRQAATYLGVPYGWDCKGYDNVYSSTSPTKQSMETVRKKGLDCSGLIYATVEISNTEVGNGFGNMPQEGSIEITKTDISTGELIPNCGIEILDKDGNVIVQGRTDENGVVKFEKLRTGEYFYREFDAPDGYILDETKYPFTIKENGEIVKCEMTNTKLPQTPPHTGDISNNIPAFVMLGLSAAIAATLCILKLKKGKKNEK